MNNQTPLPPDLTPRAPRPEPWPGARARRCPWLLALAAMQAGAAGPAWDPRQLVTESVISGQAVSGSQGVMVVNMAAGDMNLQFNGAAIAVNLADQQGKGIAAGAQQRVDVLGYTAPDVVIAAINDNAFQNSSGLMSVNQASGVANAQANSFAMVLGLDGPEASDATLAGNATSSNPVVVEPDPARLREVSVADTSFRGAQGVAQVTQTAGSWNATTNSFALRITAGVNGNQP